MADKREIEPIKSDLEEKHVLLGYAYENWYQSHYDLAFKDWVGLCELVALLIILMG
jgi:hypothetical protein